MATAKKPAASAASKSAPKAKAAASTAAPETGDEASEGATETVGSALKAPSLRIKALVDRVAGATGAKKKTVKDIVEATLRELGDALGRGEELNLPGFGKTRIARSSEKGGASHMTLKVRRGAHKKRNEDAKDPLAEDGEDS